MRKFHDLPIAKAGLSLFVALPKEAHEPIPGGCQCKFCKAHPELAPMWDTMGVSPKHDRTWIVHFPEIHDINNHHRKENA